MLSYAEKIREIAGRLLTSGVVEMIIGFRQGTIPMMNEPHFAKTPADVPKLVWDSHCGINLANYLTDRKEKIGIVAKGCDSRNIVTHIIENKIKREQLVVIGVPCRGMVDKRKIALKCPGEITAVTETEAGIIATGNGFSQSFEKKDVLQHNCALCIHRNPVIHDELVAPLVEEQAGVDRYADVRAVEVMTPEQRWKYFEDLLAPCVRCYACRNACPLCYCPTCFVDESRPQWVGKGQDPSDVRTFHFLRAYHCAGRCTDCGACERSCPVGINMRVFTKKLEKDCLDLFGWEAGLDPDVRPPLDVYRPTDPNDFIK
jgi:formate dehydrogenase (coenzyme F420) beta subunit